MVENYIIIKIFIFCWREIPELQNDVREKTNYYNTLLTEVPMDKGKNQTATRKEKLNRKVISDTTLRDLRVKTSAQ